MFPLCRTCNILFIQRPALKFSQKFHDVRGLSKSLVFQRNQRSTQLPRTLVQKCDKIVGTRDINFNRSYLIPWHIRGFHNTPRRDIHPALWIILKPILNISAALTGRTVRKWYQRLDPKDKKCVRSKLWEHWYELSLLGLALFAGIVVYYTSHVEETPITGRTRFMALTHNQMELICQTEFESICERYADKLFDENSPKYRRVYDTVFKLIQHNNELRDLKKFDKWMVYVVNDSLINACVLPTGQIFVFDGMLEIADNPDQLAVVLGHEMAHALLEHGVEELSYAQFLDYFIVVFLAALWCIIPSDGISFITQWFHKKVFNLFTHLPHSRSIEREADNVGTMFAARACFDVRQGSVLWKKMEAHKKLSNEDILPEWMSTHPDNIKRADHIDFLVPKAEGWRDEMMCPKWPNEDPRKAMEILSKKVDNYVTAKRAGQDLRHVKKVTPESKVRNPLQLSTKQAVSQADAISIKQAEGQSSDGVESVPKS